jgi:hypothetical protein
MTSPQEILRKALKLIEESDVPDDLREAAFNKSFDLLAGRSSAPLDGGVRRGGESDGDSKEVTSDGEWDSKIAMKLKVEPSQVREVFEQSDTGIALVVPSSALDDSISVGVRQIAHLVSVARQSAGLEESTSTNIIGQFAVDYGKKDKNFSRHIDGLDDLFVVKRISHREKTLRARVKAYEEAGRLVKRMLEGSQSQ